LTEQSEAINCFLKGVNMEQNGHSSPYVGLAVLWESMESGGNYYYQQAWCFIWLW